jgi:hypothetical protein
MLVGGQGRLVKDEGRPDELVDAEAWSGSEVDPLNQALGLRNDTPYIDWIANGWRAPGRFVRRDDFLTYLSEGLVERLRATVHHLRETGHLPYQALAPYLEALRFELPPPVGTGTPAEEFVGVFDAPDFPTLVAWSLERAGTSGRYRIVDCPICGSPWFQDTRALRPACYRPAPGRTSTCSQVAATERFQKRKADWMKEYRRIYARKLRGTVTPEEWNDWTEFVRLLREGTGDDSRYTPFDDWKRVRQEPDYEAGLQALKEDARPRAPTARS